MADVSGNSPGIDDEQHIDVDSNLVPAGNGCHQCQQHHQPNCLQLRSSYADHPRLKASMESEDRIGRSSDVKISARSASDLESPSEYVADTFAGTELRSLLSLATEDPNSSKKRFFDSSSSVADGSLSSGASSSSSSSSSSSAFSSPPSSPPHKKYRRLSIVPSHNNPSRLSATKSEEIFQRRLQTCPAKVGAATPPPVPATKFLIDEILKPSFGVSSKFAQSEVGFISAWGRSCAPEDRLSANPDLLLRSGLPFRPGLSSQKYEPFLISRVSAQEEEEAADRRLVIKKRKQTKPSEDDNQTCLDLRRKVDPVKGNRKLSSRVFENVERRNVGVPCCGQSPNDKSSSRHQAPPPLLVQTSRSQAQPLFVQTENSAFKSMTCSNTSAANDCSNSSTTTSSSSSNASSRVSEPMHDDNEKSNASNQHLRLSTASSASSGSSSSFQTQQLPAWVYCTRYSDRPSSGPRSRKARPRADSLDDKRPRTAFTNDQLQILKREFAANQYLNEDRRHALATKLNLNDTQIKIWFQNKRAKLKKASGVRNRLALELMAQGLYNHSTVTATGDCA